MTLFHCCTSMLTSYQLHRFLPSRFIYHHCRNRHKIPRAGKVPHERSQGSQPPWTWVRYRLLQLWFLRPDLRWCHRALDACFVLIIIPNTIKNRLIPYPGRQYASGWVFQRQKELVVINSTAPAHSIPDPSGGAQPAKQWLTLNSPTPQEQGYTM